MTTSTSLKRIVGPILPKPTDQVHPSVHENIAYILAKLPPDIHVALEKFREEFSSDWTYEKTHSKMSIAWKAVRRDLRLLASLIAKIYPNYYHLANIKTWLPQCLCRFHGINSKLRGDETAWSEHLCFEILEKCARTAIAYDKIIYWADELKNYDHLVVRVSEEYMRLSDRLLDGGLRPMHRQLYPIVAKRDDSHVEEVEGAGESSSKSGKFLWMVK